MRNVQKRTKEEILEFLAQCAKDTWSGPEGEKRAKELLAFLAKKLPQYAKTFGLTEEEILKGMEEARTYNVVNYYQEAVFPDLKEVKIYENVDAFKKMVNGKGFRCPACKKRSEKPYYCSHKDCDWKAGGLLGTMGKGLRFTFREGFPASPLIDECFMPVALEKKAPPMRRKKK